MDLTISTDNPLNTQLVGRGVTYDVRSPGTIQKHTAISRDGATVVAVIDWHTLAPNVLHMGGVEQKVSEFLTRARFSGPNRKFVVDGKTYEWQPVTGNPLSPQLVPGGKTYEWQKTSMTLLHDIKLVAMVERHSNGSSTLHVVEDALATPLLDAIVVSMILMWRIMQPTYSSHGGVGYDLRAASAERDGQTEQS